MVTKYNFKMILLLVYIVFGSFTIISIIYSTIDVDTGESLDLKFYILLIVSFVLSIVFFYKLIRKQLEDSILTRLETFLLAHRMKHLFKKYIKYEECLSEDIPVFKIPEVKTSFFNNYKYVTKYAGENYINYQDKTLLTQFEKSEVNFVLYKQTRPNSKYRSQKKVASFTGTLTIFTLDINPVIDKIFFINNSHAKDFQYSDYKLEHENKTEYGVTVYSTEPIIVNPEFYKVFTQQNIKAMFFVKNKIMVLEDRLLFEMPKYLYMTNNRLYNIKTNFKKEVYNIISFVDDYVFTRRYIKVLTNNQEKEMYDSDISFITEDFDDILKETEILN